MNLIIGLGNPGTKYINTRHNIGFRVVEELAKRHNTKLKKRLFTNAKEAHIRLFRKRLILIEPLTFMNLSGPCVLRYVNKLKASLDDTLIICDDINLPLSAIRIRAQGGPGGHNGMEAIITSLQTTAFPRLRIGIRTDESPRDLTDYVLSDFRKEELPRIKESIEHAADVSECWLRNGIGKTMNLHNG